MHIVYNLLGPIILVLAERARRAVLPLVLIFNDFRRTNHLTIHRADLRHLHT